MLEAFHFFGSLATCRKLFHHFDCNGTGSISYQEFVCGIFPEIIDVDEFSESGQGAHEDDDTDSNKNSSSSSGSSSRARSSR